MLQTHDRPSQHLWALVGDRKLTAAVAFAAMIFACLLLLSLPQAWCPAA
jgi:hypothetical protein